MNTHTKAWKRFSIRPPKNSPVPEKTNKEYCIYHAAHKDYTYSEAWVRKLVGLVNKGEI